MRRRHEFAGHISRAETAGHPYLYVPFEVPPRCTRIEVAYHYAPAQPTAEDATLDIGIFDIRGTEPFTGGFRGWSGSDRRQFFIEYGRATPGYVAGPLPSGTWSVVLGAYEIPEDGLRYWLTVSLEVAVREDVGLPPPREVAPASVRPASGGPGWYRGDLHSHTEHSDGENTIAEMAHFAKSRRLDFLAITDHNTTTHMPEIDAWRAPWKFTDPGFRVREVWQAPWRWYNWESVGKYDEELATGRRIVPVGGSDAHSAPPAQPRHPHHVGDPTTLVWCAGGLSEAAVLEGIREGRTAISDGPDGPLVWLEQSADGIVTAHFRGAEGTTLEFIADGERQLRLETPADAGSLAVPASVRFDRYLRAELRTEAPKGREDVRGLSAPVYRD
ncbi:MAG TPA: PHP domain-containing protein [Tepidiformaceae bacterium]|nr:PHP domain-containing protein [Tepidiformaceae bacterium]